MKNLFIATLALALIVMPYTYYYLPSLNQMSSMKQQIANIKSSLARCSGNYFNDYTKMNDDSKDAYNKMREKLPLIIPEFSTTKTNLRAPFDLIREKIPGEWHVVPEGRFRSGKDLIFWPFKFEYVGTCSDAVKAIAYIESSTQFMRLRDFQIETNDVLVKLSGNVELVFTEVPILQLLDKLEGNNGVIK